MRVLVAGVGYRHLCDYSFGIALIDRLAAREPAPRDVAIEDLSYNPIAVVQRLEDDDAGRRAELAIFAGAIPRVDRPPGSVTTYRWDQRLPPGDDIHAAITDAVTGVIALENTLVVARHFGVLPPTVVVVEAVPVLHAAGDALSAPLAAALERACGDVAALVRDPASAARWPIGGLAGESIPTTRFGTARISDVHARRG